MPAPNELPEAVLPELPEVIAFLLGEGELLGYSFGDRGGGMPPFWWREHLRRAYDESRAAGDGREGVRQRVLDAIPSNWLDPLLTGPSAVIGKPPYGCPEIERLLHALRERIDTAMGAGQEGCDG